MIEWYYLIVASSVFNAASLIIEKRLVRQEHALAFSMSFSFIIGLMSLLLIPFTTLSLTPLSALLTVAYSVTLALGYWMSARLFRHGSLSTGSPLYNILPVIIVVFLGFLLLGEALSITEYAAIAVMIFAAFFMVSASNKKRDKNDKEFYDQLVIINAIVVGIGWIILKYALEFTGSVTFIFFTSMITPMIVWLLLQKRTAIYKQQTRIDIEMYAKPIAIMAVVTLAYRIFLYTAVSATQVALAAPLNSTLVVMITVLFGGLLFGEHHIKRKIILSAIMLVAAYVLIA